MERAPPKLTSALGSLCDARDGGNNLLTGADNTNAGTDYVTVTVLEADGTVVDANLLGTKQLFLSGGERISPTWDCKATVV